MVGSWSEFSGTASSRVNKSGNPCAIWKESCSEFTDSRCRSALCSRNLLVGSLWERIRKRKQSLRGRSESASCFHWQVISASQATLSGFCSCAGSTVLICSWKKPLMMQLLAYLLKATSLNQNSFAIDPLPENLQCLHDVKGLERSRDFEITPKGVKCVQVQIFQKFRFLLQIIIVLLFIKKL